jgi:hypothetical protein
MPEKNNAGLAIFLALVCIFVGVGVAAYLLSGDKGMEERFSQALGLGRGDKGEAGGGLFGFRVEGNILLYAIILVALVILCAVLVRLFKI